MTTRTRTPLLLLTTALLLLVALSRLAAIPHMQITNDEVWSIWQTMGTPSQILLWTPYDWPPLYYLTLGLWRGLTGPFPFMLRYLSLLALLLGCAGIYRSASRLATPQAGMLAALAYAALGYNGVLSTEVRGYALLLGLMPLAFWLTLRYFNRPGLWRGLLLGVVLATMFYISLTSIAAIVMLGLYSLIVYQSTVWRWWLPGIAAFVLALPEIIARFQTATARIATIQSIVLPPLPAALSKLFGEYFGTALIPWLLVVLVASLLALYYARKSPRHSAALFAWVLLVPILLYLANGYLAFFNPRYAWWVMPGIALWVGVGLSRLPKIAVGGALVLLSAMTLMAVAPNNLQYGWQDASLGSNLVWLKDHIQWGDVVVLDPGNNCGASEEWDYHLHMDFPNGLQFVTDPSGFRRVWYVSFDGQQDKALLDSVTQGRVADRFVGPPGCLFRLYQAPPDPVGVLFDNGMRFHGTDVLDNGIIWTGPIVRREGETVKLRLWWSVDKPVALDYSVGTYILSTANRMFAQLDAAPQVIAPENAPSETSRWMPGTYYIEERDLALPAPISRAALKLELAVYFWQDGKRIPAPGVDADGLLLLRPMSVMAW